MALLLGQVGMPDVENEDNACSRALIAGFMLNRIVKHPSFAPLP